MSLKNQWLMNIAMVLLSWLSLFFIGKRNIKRFLPASVLIFFVETINVQFAKKRKWWVFNNKPKSYVSGELPFNIGPFFAFSMWVLKSSYGNFKRFLLLNAIIHTFFAFILMKIMKKIKVVKLVRIDGFQFFFYYFYKAFLLYGFQYMIENKRKFLSSFYCIYSLNKS